jgi:hypothetical protein
MVKKEIPLWYIYFFGYTGPFCNLHDLHQYPLLESPTAQIRIVHMDRNVGTEVWCLLMYDTILSVNKQTLIKTEKLTIQFGSHCHSHAYLQVESLNNQMAVSKHAIVTRSHPNLPTSTMGL